jgi:hypothetical protein
MGRTEKILNYLIDHRYRWAGVDPWWPIRWPTGDWKNAFCKSDNSGSQKERNKDVVYPIKGL